MFLKKMVSVFLEHLRKNIHHGGWLKQNYTNNITEVTSRKLILKEFN